MDSAIAALIDHTILRADATRADVVQLCREAVAFGFASVCLNPMWISTACEELRDAETKVCSVVGFPLGANLTATKRAETLAVMEAGAGEVDMVLPVGALVAGDSEVVRLDIEAVVEIARARGVLVKVILECALLTDEKKELACQIARRAGADFVKTSTGFGPAGATAADVSLMRRVVGDSMGVKASGGIRSLEAFEQMVAAGANRIGTSSGVMIVQAAAA